MKNWQFISVMIVSSISLIVSLAAISSDKQPTETSKFATTDETKMIFDHTEDIRLSSRKQRESDLKRLDRVEQLISEIENREHQRVVDKTIEAEQRLIEAVEKTQNN